MTSTLGPLRYVVVEGPIGVGKSTLARRLAEHLGASLLLEQPADNPFLERYYANPEGYAFQTQLAFLFQRVEQMRQLSQPGMFDHGVVSDFLFDKDAIFAALTLSPGEFRLYSQIHAHAAPPVPAPDLVLWLQARPPVLLERIRRRGIAMERSITGEYLEALCAAYTRHFQHYAAAPLLAIDTEHFHPAGDPADFERLRAAMAAFRGPRDFLGAAVASTPLDARAEEGGDNALGTLPP